MNQYYTAVEKREVEAPSPTLWDVWYYLVFTNRVSMCDVLARIGFWPPNLHKVHRPYSVSVRGILWAIRLDLQEDIPLLCGLYPYRTCAILWPHFWLPAPNESKPLSINNIHYKPLGPKTGFGWTGASFRTMSILYFYEILRECSNCQDRQECDGPSDATRPTPDRESDDSVR
jgi:hypothetical protein